MSGTWRACLLIVAACGGGEAMPDAGTDPVPDAMIEPDAEYSACVEFATPTLMISELPAAVAGELAGAGADIAAPVTCDQIDAPFGIESEGADRVYALLGLEIGVEYVVRLDSSDDLAFYVVSGCGGADGPTSGQCALFVDAVVDEAEVGRFVADDDRAYVVVDYYAAGEPVAGDFTLEVYPVACQASATCGGVAPVCQDFRCVGCASDFDCDTADLPLCDAPAHTCVAGYAACVGDDDAESGDDGPAGATTLTPGVAIDAAICNSPTAERDFFRFHVTDPGEHWTIAVTWSAAVDLDLEIYDANGTVMGRSYHEQPEGVALTYLPAGDYYAEVDYFAATTSLSVPYTITATQVTGDTCASAADCADEWRNQIYRGACVGGACEPIAGDGAVAAGDACDSSSDCDGTGNCASFFFVADADTRMVCGDYCDTTADCAGLGSDYLCSDYLVDNFCVQKCTSSDQCPTIPQQTPASPPWARFSCQLATGRCIPP